MRQYLFRVDVRTWQETGEHDEIIILSARNGIRWLVDHHTSVGWFADRGIQDVSALHLDYGAVSYAMNRIGNENSMTGRGDNAIEDTMIKLLNVKNECDVPVRNELIGNVHLVFSLQHSKEML